MSSIPVAEEKPAPGGGNGLCSWVLVLGQVFRLQGSSSASTWSRVSSWGGGGRAGWFASPHLGERAGFWASNSRWTRYSAQPKGGQHVGAWMGSPKRSWGPFQVQAGAPGALGAVAAVDHQQQAVRVVLVRTNRSKASRFAVGPLRCGTPLWPARLCERPGACPAAGTRRAGPGPPGPQGKHPRLKGSR